MINKFFFVIIFFPSMILCQSKTYFPLDSGNYWIYANNPKYRMEVGGTKIINNKSYKVIVLGQYKLDTNYYRVDGSKIFKLNVDNEWLLYDFSLLTYSIMFSDTNYTYGCDYSAMELYQGRNLRKWIFAYHYKGMFDVDSYEYVVDSIGVVTRGGGLGAPLLLTQAFINGKLIIVTDVKTQINKVSSDLRLNVFPNPFNSSAIISYSIPIAGYIVIKLLNTVGQEISTIFSGEAAAGVHNIKLNANDLSSGIYFCQLIINNKNIVQKIQLLK